MQGFGLLQVMSKRLWLSLRLLDVARVVMCWVKLPGRQSSGGYYRR
jgi:hypothetical protein